MSTVTGGGFSAVVSRTPTPASDGRGSAGTPSKKDVEERTDALAREALRASPKAEVVGGKEVAGELRARLEAGSQSPNPLLRIRSARSLQQLKDATN